MYNTQGYIRAHQDQGDSLLSDLRPATSTQRRSHANICLAQELLWATYPGMAVAVLFFGTHDVSSAEVTHIQSAVAVAGAIAAIPGGYLTDQLGVRSVALSINALLTIQALLFWTSNSYSQHMALAPLSGVAWCMTGTLTNSLMSRELPEVALQHFNTQCSQARNMGIIGGLALGGFMVQGEDVELPFIVQPIIHIASIIVAFRLPRKEDEQGPVSLGHRTHKSLTNISVAVSGVMTQAEIRWLIIFFAVLHSVTMTGFWLIQPRLVSMGVTKDLFDEVYMARAIAAIVVVQVVQWLTQLLSEYAMVGALLVPMALGAITAAMWTGWDGLAIFLLGYSISSSSQTPLERTMLAKRLKESSFRTTELAIPSVFNPAMFMGMSGVFGFIGSAFSTEATFASMAAILLIVGGGALFMARQSVRR